MGFNFQAGHPQDIFGEQEAQSIIAKLSAAIDPPPPFGDPDAYYCLNDEIGWPDWSDLQVLAREQLGDEKCTQICNIDAWYGVYVDSKVDRILVPRVATKEEFRAYPPKLVPHSLTKENLLQRILRRIGLRKRVTLSDEFISELQGMVDAFGARDGEQGAMQVGNLRSLNDELESLIAALGYQVSEDAIERLRRSYVEDDDRVDEDPAIQCLCHAWLTAQHAIRNKCPLWLIK